jgi:phosphoglucomutase
LESNLNGLRRIPLARALALSTTHRHDVMGAYIADLGDIIDMQVIRDAKLRLGVDLLGGAGVHYWARIAERCAIDLTFRFMSRDCAGKIRMDPSSSHAMQCLIGLRDCFDLSCACDTDHDRHGNVARSVGLLPPNHYLCPAISYLFRNRLGWSAAAAVGKTVVSSQRIDRIARSLKRTLFEVPVGFKWFSAGLFDGSLGFSGEESAGAAFLRRSGTVWTTDKDGMVPALLAAEMTAKMGRDPGEIHEDLVRAHNAPATSGLMWRRRQRSRSAWANGQPAMRMAPIWRGSPSPASWCRRQAAGHAWEE